MSESADAHRRDLRCVKASSDEGGKVLRHHSDAFMRLLGSIGSHLSVQARQKIVHPLTATAKLICPTNADQTARMSIAQVDQALYGEQLSGKVQRVKAKFADFSAPELEVFESQSEHYRMRYAMNYPR